MIQNQNSLKSDRKRKTLRDTSLSCDTNKIRSNKKRLCLKCGKKFLSIGPYNRICEKCSLINKRMALHTHSVSSKHLDEEKDPIPRYSSVIRW
jgi:predicted amidophosphoribosyltransferase